MHDSKTDYCYKYIKVGDIVSLRDYSPENKYKILEIREHDFIGFDLKRKREIPILHVYMGERVIFNIHDTGL